MSSRQGRGGFVGSLVERILSNRSGYDWALLSDTAWLNFPACGGPVEGS